MDLFSNSILTAQPFFNRNNKINGIGFSILLQVVIIVMTILNCTPYSYVTDHSKNSSNLQSFASCGNSIEYHSDKYIDLDSTFPIHKTIARQFVENKIPLIEDYFNRNITYLKKDTARMSVEFQSNQSILISYLTHVKDSIVAIKEINQIIQASQYLDSSLIYSVCVELSIIRNNNNTAHLNIDDVNYSTVLGRSKESIMRGIMKILGKMRYEYNKILRQNHGVKGKMTLKFIIDETGKVIFLKVIESTLNNCEMENREVNIVKDCLFEPAKNKPNLTTVVYPFIFSQ